MYVRKFLSVIIKKKYDVLSGKLGKLKNNKTKCKTNCKSRSDTFAFHEPVKNLTDVSFTQEELEHIEKGYTSKFEQPSQSYIKDDLIVNTEYIIRGVELNNQIPLRYEAAKILFEPNIIPNNKIKKDVFSHQIIKNTIKKIQQNNLSVSRADKGNVLVIASKNMIIDKTNQFLSDPNFQLLVSDPTSRFQQEIKNVIKISNTIIDSRFNKILINSNPKSPILRSTIKIHKINNPIRPIVNYIPAPAYKLKKYINNLLKDILILPYQHNIKNSKFLTDKIGNLKITQHCRIISLDINNMYTNIPLEETLIIIKEKLEQLHFPGIYIEQFINLTRCVLHQNYFYFDNKYYIQKDGLPMGSPLSSLISEIFLQYLESIYIDEITKEFNILFYGRYVDDILIIYDNSKNVDNQILNSFNLIHPKIQYTLETEQNNKINFLDLTIKKINNAIRFSIYRKPTTSKTSIHNSSISPKSHKYANIRFLLQRLNTIPLSKKDYNIEFSNILNIAYHNGFSYNNINRINKQIKQRIYFKNKTSLKRGKKEKWFSIPYYSGISSTLKKLFCKNNINITYSSYNHIRTQLKNKPKHDSQMSQSGIYQLHCQCGKQYIGRTIRQFQTRYKEHKHNFKYGITDKSKFAAHCLENGHPFLPLESSFSVIKNVNKIDQIDIWETLAISKKFPTGMLINDQIPEINNPLFYTK